MRTSQRLNGWLLSIRSSKRMGSARKSKPFDAAKYLDSDEAVSAYITEALLTDDVNVITHAIGVAAKARGMTQIAEQAGLSRESLYKALRGDGNPQFETIFRVLAALGLRLRAEPATESKQAA
jgi:probable addiction module antidote protein